MHLEDLCATAEGEPRGHQKNLEGIANSSWWYADYPTHLAGDPRPATAEKGVFWLAAAARDLARQIKIIKEDKVSARLAKEFYDAAQHPDKPPR